MTARFSGTMTLHIAIIPQSFKAGQTHYLFGMGKGVGRNSGYFGILKVTTQVSCVRNH